LSLGAEESVSTDKPIGFEVFFIADELMPL
jgi:hypothetical protein